MLRGCNMREEKKKIYGLWSCTKNKMSSVLYIFLQLKTRHWVRGEGGKKDHTWPYLLGHISMERLFISLSHLQHSDIKSKAQKSYNQTIHHLCVYVSGSCRFKQSCAMCLTLVFTSFCGFEPEYCVKQVYWILTHHVTLNWKQWFCYDQRMT